MDTILIHPIAGIYVTTGLRGIIITILIITITDIITGTGIITTTGITGTGTGTGIMFPQLEAVLQAAMTAIKPPEGEHYPSPGQLAHPPILRVLFPHLLKISAFPREMRHPSRHLLRLHPVKPNHIQPPNLLPVEAHPHPQKNKKKPKRKIQTIAAAVNQDGKHYEKDTFYCFFEYSDSVCTVQ